MSDDKPLRYEDYQAMAEENRRLREELRQVRGSAEHATLSKKRWWEKVGWGFVFIVAGSVLMVLAVVVQLVSTEQKRPCYFVRHALDEDADARAMPWEHWHLFRSRCVFCLNEWVRGPSGAVEHFSSKDEAWSFIKHCNLEACK